MKLLLTMLLLSCAGLVVAGKAHATTGKAAPYRYLKELAANAPVPLAEVVGASYFRQNFPKSYKSPYWHDYLIQKHAEGKSDEEAAELYQFMFGSGEALTEEQTIDLLMADPVYRAHVIAHYSIASGVMIQAYEQLGDGACPSCGKHHTPEELVDNIFGLNKDDVAYGRELIPLVMATDGDYSLDELRDRLSELATHSFAIRYRQHELNIDSHTNNHGYYLMRHTHVRHPPPSPFDLTELQQGGYDIDIMRQELPTVPLTPVLLDNRVLPTSIVDERARIGALDFALAMDFILEAGILVPGFSPNRIEEETFADWQINLAKLTHSIPQHLPGSITRILFHAAGQKDVLAALAIELGLEVDSADFAAHLTAIEDLANHPQHKASLFQVVQLDRLGFSLEEIKMLSYDARDAIIVSNPEGREDFVAKLSASLGIKDFNSQAINAIEAKTGPLVFMLLDNDYDLEDIQPHNSSMYKHLEW